MKVFKLVLLTLILSFPTIAKAQVSVNVNIGTPPAWGPVGYAESRYYYLPDIHSYYDVSTEMFICMGSRGWFHTRVLPSMYADFDLYNGCKVVLDFRGDNPYHYYETHRVRYPVGYRIYDQRPYRRRHDNGHHYGEYKHGKSKHREVIYVNEYGGGRRDYNDDHDDDRGNGHGHGHRRG